MEFSQHFYPKMEEDQNFYFSIGFNSFVNVFFKETFTERNMI